MEQLFYTKLISLGFLFLMVILLSFHKKSKFYKKWIATLPPIFITGLIFIFWDVKFAIANIWNFHFNTISISKFGIPLEEIVFYFTFLFAGFFIYDFLKSIPKRIHDNAMLVLSLVLMLVFGSTAYINMGKLYTLSVFMFAFAYLAYTIFRNRFKPNYSNFYFSYLILSVLYIFYHSLTGIPEIINYHTSHILGILIINIPLENFIKLFLLMLMNFTIYEYFLVKRKF